MQRVYITAYAAKRAALHKAGKEALQRKKKIITKSDRKAFQDWMFAQEQEYEQFFTALGN